MKRVAYIFFVAFGLNLVWENLHVFLYESYKGGSITELILVRAALFDAFVIMLIMVPFLYVPLLRQKSWLIFLVGIVVGICNEWYGLGTGRWVYDSLMPIVPIVGVGLTPLLQLGVLGFASYLIQERTSV